VYEKRFARPFSLTLWRSVKLRCPGCGRASIFRRPFNLKERCSACDVIFKREEGFFVGAILANVVTTELVIVVTYLLSLLIIASHYELILAILFVVGVTFPVVFYHHSWSFWLGLDHLIEGLQRRA
jgi:uncharacterized protein (DUF983 family)